MFEPITSTLTKRGEHQHEIDAVPRCDMTSRAVEYRMMQFCIS